MTSFTRNGFSARRYAVALTACALATAVAALLYGRLHAESLVLLYLLAVALVAALGGRGPAVLASVVAVACFDFFFVEPRWSLSVADADYLLTFAVMLLVALLVAQLTNAYRDKATESERSAAESRVLQRLAVALSGALSPADLAARLAAECRAQLGAQAWLFRRDDDGHLAWAAVPGATLPEELAQLAEDAGRRGSAMTTPRPSAPATTVLCQPLTCNGRERGVLLLQLADDETRVSQLAPAIAAIVTTALERLHFTEVALDTMLAMQSERLRNSILAGIAHDLRTPLTILQGLAESLALHPSLPDDVRATADALSDHSRRLHRTAENLLDMASLRSGRLELRHEWESMADIVAASVRTLQPWLATDRLHLDFPAELPLVRVDAMLMERVFCNLLENAVKYSRPASRIIVRGRVRGDALDVMVLNEGGHFEPPRLRQIAELFERGASDAPPAGMGVGLLLCNAIVSAHGGRIAVGNDEAGAWASVALTVEEAPPLDEESR